MNPPALEFQPGTLLRARGREWVVQPLSAPGLLHLRPLGGSDEHFTVLAQELELEPVTSATFSPPDPTRPGAHDAARLLRDALQLKLRAGAGPFRSFGNIAVEPRAYQLVPLLMALRLPTVRLLIADDVGIGKTIEAGLIARELLDRGEINRLAVLCPPHLVDQWVRELDLRFHLRAIALTSSTVARIERDKPDGVNLFDHHPVVVVSLDYIKSERHRDHFLSAAPECVLVDEAHTCAAAGPGKQLRFELLRKLAADEARHLVLLTATPHSGDDSAFHNLLSLLKPEFATLAGQAPDARKPLREELARHFVQRRRKDIEEWQEDRSLFPKRETAELTYALSGRWGRFFDSVQEYCVDLAQRTEREGSGGGSRLIWYATLALLRCVASSPAAAQKALSTRLLGTLEELEALASGENLADGEADNLAVTDQEPAAQVDGEDARLRELIAEAGALAGTQGDPKLAALIDHLAGLLEAGFHPVVFCRYVATAKYVAEHLRTRFKHATVAAVTGELSPEERAERVADLGENETRILVATDCLSEGVNLQEHFTSVVHYDLAWNPTRHEQREGRVDRFGQKAPVVRCSMLYGQDNPIDGFILKVILRKAEAIRQELGVLVPMPADEPRMNQAMVKAALMKRAGRKVQQDEFDFGELTPDLQPLELQWRDAMEKAKVNRTVFAQRRLKPEEVLPEWRKQLAILGDENDVARFVTQSCARLNAPLEPYKRSTHRLLPQHLPQALRERLNGAGIAKALVVDFHYPPVGGAHFVHRSHPLAALLADTLVEGALTGDTRLAARAAATLTKTVEVVTTVYLLRLRHQLLTNRTAGCRTLMAEETLAIAVRGRAKPEWQTNADSAALLDAKPSGNLPTDVATREIRLSLDYLAQSAARLEEFAHARAQELLADHRRVRQAARDSGQTTVKPCLPVDVMGVYVLLPDAF